MFTNSKHKSSKLNFNKCLHSSPKQEKSSNVSIIEIDDINTVFRDLHLSVLSKAINISPNVTSTTLGSDSFKDRSHDSIESISDLSEKAEENSFVSQENDSVLNTSIQNPSKAIKNLSKVLSKSLDLNQSGCNEKICSSKKNLNKSENTFSYQKLLQEYDNQRRLTVDKVVNERIQNMYDSEKLIRDSLEHLKKTRQEEANTRRLLLESKIINDIHEQEILNKPVREAQWEKDNLKEALRIQERNQKVKEAEEEARKKFELILLKRKHSNYILSELQKEYNQEYKNMLETIKLCKVKTAVPEVTVTLSKLSKNSAAYESLLKKWKSGEDTDEFVETFREVVETIKSIHQSFLKEIAKINTAPCIENKNVESVQKKETEAEVKSNSDLSDCYDAKSLQLYLSLKSNLENFEKVLSPLLSEDSLKKFRFNCQKAVTIPVNAISPVSGAHMTDKYLKLHNLLSGRAVEVGDVKVVATQHPLGVQFCKLLLAKKFVRQGDLTVSSKPDAAFSIAAVLISLWVDFPDFGQLVLAHFHHICPYLAPVFMPQVEGQSDEDYHKSLGYHYSQSGDVEKQDSFLKRMSGIMRLYAALIIAKPKQPGKMNPLGLSEGWRWISSLLNLEPRPDISATLLYDFLEVAGNEMFRAYGSQFKKVLAYICQEYFPKLEKVTPSGAGGPMVRLENFLQRTLKEESIPPPQGLIPPNFW